MIIFASFLQCIYLSLSELAWSALSMILSGHVIMSFVFLMLARKAVLVESPINFLYYYMVTATTVGYGDLSPKTGMGRMVAVLFVLPGGIAICTAVLGKLLTGISTIWRNRMRGLGNYGERSGHIVLLGWQGGQTHQTLRLLEASTIAWTRLGDTA